MMTMTVDIACFWHLFAKFLCSNFLYLAVFESVLIYTSTCWSYFTFSTQADHCNKRIPLLSFTRQLQKQILCNCKAQRMSCLKSGSTANPTGTRTWFMPNWAAANLMSLYRQQSICLYYTSLYFAAPFP